MRLTEKLSLCWRILREKPGSLIAHAERELPSAAGDDMQALMNQNLRELVLVFSTQGHSGFSAPWAVGCLEKLLSFEPLRPLTGEDSEWTEVTDGYWQNKRCSRVFKGADGRAYDIDGRVFRNSLGCYTNWNSRVYITFPYTPTTEYVDVADTEPGGAG